MLAFRSLVAAIFAVLTLLGGAFRAPAIDGIQGQLVLERPAEDRGQSSLERGRANVQVRATRASRSTDTRDPGVSLGASAIALRSIDDRLDGELASTPPSTRETSTRRVRIHVTNMVFLL